MYVPGSTEYNSSNFLTYSQHLRGSDPVPVYIDNHFPAIFYLEGSKDHLMNSYYLYEIMNEKIMIKLPISFILGGALGNVYDRVMMFIDPINVGGVVDFIDIGISFSMRWYIFNIADTAITCGIILYLIDTFYTKENNSLIRH